jgi:hypothetical protein
MKSLNQTFNKARHTFSQILLEQIQPAWKFFCSDVRLVAYGHHRWENPMVRSTERVGTNAADEHVKYVLESMQTWSDYLSNPQTMVEDYFATMDRLADERDVFLALSEAQRKTMRSKDLAALVQGDGCFMTPEWLQDCGGHELNNAERSKIIEKHRVSGKRRMLWRALQAWWQGIGSDDDMRGTPELQAEEVWGASASCSAPTFARRRSICAVRLTEMGRREGEEGREGGQPNFFVSRVPLP